MDGVVFLQPPSPPGLNVLRDYAGGYGTASASSRSRYGHDGRAHYMPSLLTAATLTQRDRAVALIDAQALDLDLPAVVAEVAARRPAYVVGPLSLPSLWSDAAVYRAVREASGARVIGFGTIVRREWAALLERGALDVALLGDVEQQLLGVLAALDAGADLLGLPGVGVRVGGEPRRSDGTPMLASLDDLPIPDYSLLSMERYWYHELRDRGALALVYTSRGCPFACGYYCPYPYGFGRKVRYRSPELVGRELELLIKRHGVSAILFRDQVFTVNRRHAEAVCRQILDRGLDLAWVCETKYDLVDAGLLALMKRAGCRSIHYGLESGDAELFWTVGKPGGRGSPQQAMARFRETIRLTRRARIRAHVHTIIGLPGETAASIEQTCVTLRVMGVDSVQVGLATPYPGTRFHDDSVERGWLHETDPSKMTVVDAVLSYPGLSAQEMLCGRDRVLGAVSPQRVRVRRRLGTLARRVLPDRWVSAGGRLARAVGT